MTTTIPITIDEMLVLTRAAARGVSRRHEQRGSGPGARRRSGRVTDRLAGHGSTPRVTSRNPEHTDRSGVVLETRCRRGESISAAAPLTNNPRGARQLDAGSRHNLVFGGSRQDPDHDAAMRIDGEAPGRQSHSQKRHRSQGSRRVTAASDRHRRFVMRGRPAPKPFAFAISLSSVMTPYAG